MDKPSEQETSVLPLYVPREHDDELALVVERVVAGENAMAVLVGGSSTGKTRACWEALAPLRELEDWRLWHPINPTRPDAVLAGLGRMGARTVVWLNEAQDYLGARDNRLGEKAAAGLRELLRSPERGPVLVLATLWQDHWDTLTTRSEDGTQDDPHAQARELLAGRKISVPEAFTGSALETLAAAAKKDARLAQALTQAADRQITQYLAGVPVLMDRYREASPAARALIHAAMDYSRLGRGLDLSHDLLNSAAPGYLTDSQWNALAEDWFEQAIAYLSRPSNGIPGPLTRIKIRPHSRPAAKLTDSICLHEARSLYKLTDYLAQYGRRTRWFALPPDSFWLAATMHVYDHDSLVSLANSARYHWRIRYAASLYQRAALAGSIAALRGLADIEENRGNLIAAERYLRTAAAERDAEALVKLGDLKKDMGDLPAAEYYYRQAADAGSNTGLRELAALLIQSGNKEEGERLAAQAAASRGPKRFRMRTLEEIQEKHGGKAEAEKTFRDLLVNRVKGTNTTVLAILAQMREEAGDEAEAEILASQAAGEGDMTGWVFLAEMRANRDDMQGAERAARIAVDRGDSRALLAIAQAAAGEDPRWRDILHFGLEVDGTTSNPWEIDNSPWK